MVLIDLDICVNLILYISSHVIFVKKLFKHQSLKGERAEKVLLRKLVRLGKVEQIVFKLYNAKTKGLFFQRNIKNFMASMLKNWVVLIKVWKMKAKWKAFNQCKHFSGEPYTFISTSKISHLTSCYMCITWLNWLLKLHARLWTDSYLILTHNTQV